MRDGLYISFGAGIDVGRNRRLQALARWLLAERQGGVTDVIPGYTNLYVEFDSEKLAGADVRARLETAAERVEVAAGVETVTIPTRYDGADLAEVASRVGLEPAEVVRRHSGVSYHVFAMGFTSGFPFMGEVEESLRLPRRPKPRARVPAHSVAIANQQTGIYPLASPGGWNLLGTALEAVYDPHRAEPFLLEPGDHVVFRPADGTTPVEPEPLALLPEEPRSAFLRVRRAGLLDLVMDRGRFLAGRFGLSRSGPLDAALAGLANRLVGNGPGAPLLELTLTGPVLEALRPGVVAVTGEALQPLVNGEPQAPFSSFALRRGDVLSFRPTSEGCRSYLAVAGGIESGRFLGSASVDLRSRIGRPLMEGDVLGVVEERRARPGRSFTPYRGPRAPLVVRLLPGPQADREALELLCRSEFAVGRADRMGVQLDGPAVAGHDVTSEATPLGAVQLTTGGTPIILLHDRGTLGGYAKPAVVHPADLGQVAQLRAGQPLRFRMVRGSS